MTGWRRRAARVLFRIARVFELAGRGVHYFIIGMLTRADLDRMSADAWQSFGGDEVVMAAGLFAWERAIFEEFLPPGGRVLLVGSGSGRDLVGLCRAGYTPIGVEQSPLPIERARQLLAREGLAVPIVSGRFETAPLPGAFDAVVFSWFSYCHIQGAAERAAALRKGLAHLTPAGRIVISYVTVDAPLDTRGIRIAQLAARLTRSGWQPEPHDSFHPVAAPVPLYAYQHSFLDSELKAEAAAAGARVLAFRRFPEASVVVLASCE